MAKDFNNPRWLRIPFTTFRHCKATIEYHKTKDILYVKQLLGHKSFSSTMIYIDIEKAIYRRTTRMSSSAESPHRIRVHMR